MAKSREGKPEEFFLGIIRQQKAEIRSLKKRLKRLERDLLLKEPGEDEEDDEIKADVCMHCGKGILTIMDIGIRRYTICSVCRNRERI